MGKMFGAIVVAANTKLPAELTAEKLEELAHADLHERVYGIVKFTEYAKNGGEPQTAANGYGPEEFNGFSARKDTFTMNRFYPELHASITRAANMERGVYFFDENNVLYGVKDGTDTLAPFDMSCIYSDATPHPTSSAKATQTVTFCYSDAKQAVVDFDFVKLDFNPMKLTLGLTEVILKKTTDAGSAYKIYEKVGGYDVTEIYGPLIAEAGSTVINGSTSAATYNEADNTITIAGTGTVSLKSPKVLYQNDIKGIVQVSA
jgi:hypothetical protein